jgi:transcriptional regulator with XRE-family HTH domain
VHHRSEIREFLASRRAGITPQQAGVPVFGGTRQVPGLRREEAAMLAGVSVDYYTRLERGNLKGVSETVLDALARGLQLDELARSSAGAPGSQLDLRPGHGADHDPLHSR